MKKYEAFDRREHSGPSLRSFDPNQNAQQRSVCTRRRRHVPRMTTRRSGRRPWRHFLLVAHWINHGAAISKPVGCGLQPRAIRALVARSWRACSASCSLRRKARSIWSRSRRLSGSALSFMNANFLRRKNLWLSSFYGNCWTVVGLPDIRPYSPAEDGRTKVCRRKSRAATRLSLPPVGCRRP